MNALKKVSLVSPQQPRIAYLAAIFAGAMWGVSFIAPRALAGEDAFTLSLFRFLFFGGISAVSLSRRRRQLPRFTMRDLGRATLLSALGYSLYYSFLALGVAHAGVAYATLIIGLLPLTILLFSVPRFEARVLAFPLLLVLIGALLIPVDLLRSESAVLGTPLERMGGVIASLAALASWTVFSIWNSNFLKRTPSVSPLDWSSALGVMAGLTAIVFFGLAHPGNAVEIFRHALTREVLLWTGFMGIFGAWVATALWNFASRILPAAVVGQLLVTEMVFGLLFGFLYEARLPTYPEAATMGLLLSGAFFGVRAVNRIVKSVDGRMDRT